MEGGAIHSNTAGLAAADFLNGSGTFTLLQTEGYTWYKDEPNNRYSENNKNPYEIPAGTDSGMAYLIAVASRFTITATAGENGTITLVDQGTVNPGSSRDFTVNQGSNATFAIEAASGYKIANVVVEGGSVDLGSEYIFEDVQKDHTIQATFAQVQLQGEGTEDSPPIRSPTPRIWRTSGTSSTGATA